MHSKNYEKRAPARVVWAVALAILTAAPIAGAHDDRDHDDDDSGYWSDDYDELRGWGRWRWVPSVGARCWFPYVDASWRPYYHGHWVYSPAGMTWVSYEPWGAVPHHYGNWVFVDGRGWGWVPGYVYSPAWVTWGVVDGYVGWAPCPPAGYRYPRYHRYHAGVHVTKYGFAGNFGYHSSGLDFSFWIFLNDDDFYGSPVHCHALPSAESLSLFKRKKVLPVGSQLDVNYVKKISKARITTVETERTTRRVGDRTVDYWTTKGQDAKVRAGRELAERSTTRAKAIARKPAKGSVPVARVDRSERDAPQKKRADAATSPAPTVRGESVKKKSSERAEGPSRKKASKNEPASKSRSEREAKGRTR